MNLLNYGVNFNGRRIVHPGAYDYTDSSAMLVTTPGSVNLPVVVGQAEAGECGKVKWFTNLDAARQYLVGGEILDALDLMFSPAPEGGGGASMVGVIVANQTISASATIGGLKLTSVITGEGGNRIQTKLENGNVPGTYRFTVTRWDTGFVRVFNDVGAIIKIKYKGTQPYAVVCVDKDTDGKATRLYTKVGTDAASAVVDLDVDLKDPRFSMAESVVQYLAGVSDYVLTFVSPESSQLDTSTFKSTVGTDIIGDNGYVLSPDADLVYRINTFSQLLTAEQTGVIATFPATYLSGGSKGVLPATWIPYFAELRKSYSDILVVLSSNQSIHAEALAHVQQMEQRKQKQVMFTGGGVGETTEQAKQRASMLNSSRAVLAYPGVYHRNMGAGKKVLPCYFTAAMIAGRVAGVPPSEPITFDYFNLVGLERELIVGDPDIDDLITSGVATLETVIGGGVRLVQGITTYTGANNTLLREISVRRGADALTTTMTHTMEDTFVGKRGLPATISAVTSKARDVLDAAVLSGDIVGYGAITVRFVGTAVYVDYQVAPVEPINFVLLTAHFVPDNTMSL